MKKPPKRKPRRQFPLDVLVKAHAEERRAWAAERRELYALLGRPVPKVPSDRAGSAGRSRQTPPTPLDAEFQAVAALTAEGLRQDPDGEGVIEIATGRLWEDAAEFRAHRNLCAMKKVPLSTDPTSALLD